MAKSKNGSGDEDRAEIRARLTRLEDHVGIDRR
jgi:hypothetical protein